MSRPGNIWRKIHGRVTRRPTNFSWVITEKLAGSGMPTSLEEFDWIRGQGVKAVVTMTENPLSEQWIGSMEYLHVPTPDLTAPDMERIDTAVDFIHDHINNGMPVMVHCAAGMGRAGTILACYLVKYQKHTSREAIETIRHKRPGSIQSKVQEIAVRLYSKHV